MLKDAIITTNFILTFQTITKPNTPHPAQNTNICMAEELETYKSSNVLDWLDDS
jgi:hypothetical protein